MRKFLQKILQKPVLTLAARFDSKPDEASIHKAMEQLSKDILKENGSHGKIIPFETSEKSFIIFSDQHKGAKNGSDDFAFAEKNYLAALDHYLDKGFHLISLGDTEELWENLPWTVVKHNEASIQREKKFVEQKAFTKIFGNHDLEWVNNPFIENELEKMYGEKIPVYEGIILQTALNERTVNIFLTHGHQGDKASDGNWFSKFFVAKIWAPLQSFLHINPNTPANNDQLKTLHNKYMYEWVAPKKNWLLITGHTHQPVFESMTHLERLYHKLEKATKENNALAIEALKSEIKKRKLKGNTIPDFTAHKPTYFNAGCCCYNDGDITGIEITQGVIRLIKWEYDEQSIPQRILLEEVRMSELINL